MTPTKPRKKPRKLTVAQELAFRMPIKQPSSADRIIPPRARMGVKVNG
jgi:hypothetical protein